MIFNQQLAERYFLIMGRLGIPINTSKSIIPKKTSEGG